LLVFLAARREKLRYAANAWFLTNYDACFLARVLNLVVETQRGLKPTQAV
jgi:hypothetical protein